MFDVEHKTAAQQSSWSSSLEVRLGGEINSVFDEGDYPIRLTMRRLLNDELVTSYDIWPGYFATFANTECSYVEAFTSKGVKILREEWHPVTNGCTSDSLFYTWCLKNTGSKGIAIGTNDGTTGEYVFPLITGIVDEIVMVEASDRIFNKLKTNYENRKNISLLNTLVSTDGQRLTFYESVSGSGLVNSTRKDIAGFFGDELLSVEKESIGINEIIEQHLPDLDWLHLDLEGMDDDVIRALDFSRTRKPKVIVFESHVDNEKQSETFEFLTANGYEVFGTEGQINKIAILRK